MKIILEDQGNQGSQEWIELRKKYDTASEASAMMSCSANVRRDELLHMKATGSAKEFSDWFQANILDKGHAVEAMSLEMAEAIIGEDLYPTVGVSDDGKLLASFDGLTMSGRVGWECKQFNKDKASTVRQGKVPKEDYWQVVQQLVVSGADSILYMVTDGSDDNCVSTWVSLNDDHKQKLLDGWHIFNEDLANYEPPTATVQRVGVRPENLPSLHIEVTGMVTTSNLQQFRDHALTVLDSINLTLVSDQDFADAKAVVKWCSDVEKRLADKKDAILAQAESIYEAISTMNELGEEVRQKRLSLSKLVTAQEAAIKKGIENAGREEWERFRENLSLSLSPARLPHIAIDIPGAMKGKRTIATLESACNDEVARAKLEATEIANVYRVNLDYLKANASDYRFLFNDLDSIIGNTKEGFEAIVSSRIADHKAAEEKRLAEQREKMRLEEERKAREKIEAEQEAERQRVAAEERAKREAEQRRASAQRKAEIEAAWQEASAAAIAESEEQEPSQQSVECPEAPKQAGTAVSEPAKPTLLDAEARRINTAANKLVNTDERTKVEIDISCWLFDHIDITQHQARVIASAIYSGCVPHVAVQAPKAVNA